MSEKEPGDDRPSLEMPSFGFGRKQKKAAPEDSDRAVAPEPVPGPHRVPGPQPLSQPEQVATQRLDPVAVTPAAPALFVDEAPATAPPAAGPPTYAALDEEPAPLARRQRRELAMPAIGGMAASIVTGVLVGLLTVGATWGSLRLCEVVRGTPSCGNPGFFVLLAIMVAMVLIGRALLRAFSVPDPGSTSFLAMGLVAVVALLFLVDLLFLWWMVLVIPAVSLAAYALAHWVTTWFAEPDDRNMHR
ncbi:MAG: hypothetical protein ACXWDL_09290 [Nocardioides sp.]